MAVLLRNNSKSRKSVSRAIYLRLVAANCGTRLVMTTGRLNSWLVQNLMYNTARCSLVKTQILAFNNKTSEMYKYIEDRWLIQASIGCRTNIQMFLHRNLSHLLPKTTSSRAYFSLFLKHAFSQNWVSFIWQARYTFLSGRRAALAACMTFGRL